MSDESWASICLRRREEDAESESEAELEVSCLRRELISVFPVMRLLIDNKDDMLSVFASSSSKEDREPPLIRELILLSELAVRVLERPVSVGEVVFVSSFTGVWDDSFFFITGDDGEVIEGDETDGIEGMLICAGRKKMLYPCMLSQMRRLRADLFL